MTDTWTSTVNVDNLEATITEEVWTSNDAPGITYSTTVVNTTTVVSGGGSTVEGDILTFFDFRPLPDGLIVNNATNGDGALDPLTDSYPTFPCIIDRSSFGADAQEAWAVDGSLKVRAAGYVEPGTGDLSGVIVALGEGELTSHRLTMRLRGVERGDDGTAEFTSPDNTAEAHTEFATFSGAALSLTVHYYKTATIEHTDVEVATNVPVNTVLWSTSYTGDHVRGRWVLDHRGGGDYRVIRDGVQIGQVTDTSIDPVDFGSVIFAARTAYFVDAPIAVLVDGGGISPSQVPIATFGSDAGPGGGSGSGDVVGPASSTVGRAAEFADTTGKLLRQANLTGAGGRPVLDGSGTWADNLIPSTIARDSEVTSAISTHAGATDPHGDRAYTDTAVSSKVPTTRTLAGLDLSADRDAASIKTALSLVKGDVGLGSVDNTADTAKPVSTAQQTALDAKVPTTRTLAGLDLSADRTAAALRTALGLVVGTDVQAYDAELAALAGLTSAADKLPYFTGSGTASLTTLSSYGRTLAALADLAALRTELAQSAVVLADTVLGSANAAITASWSGDYDDIRLVLIGRVSITSAGTATVTIQFNSDTGSNYYNTAGTAATSLTLGVLAGSQTNTDRTGRIDANISNMAARHTFTSTYLAANSTSNASTSGTGNGTYASTSRITSIQLACGATTFAAGTRLIVVGRA